MGINTAQACVIHKMRHPIKYLMPLAIALFGSASFSVTYGPPVYSLFVDVVGTANPLTRSQEE